MKDTTASDIEAILRFRKEICRLATYGRGDLTGQMCVSCPHGFETPLIELGQMNDYEWSIKYEFHPYMRLQDNIYG